MGSYHPCAVSSCLSWWLLAIVWQSNFCAIIQVPTMIEHEIHQCYSWIRLGCTSCCMVDNLSTVSLFSFAFPVQRILYNSWLDEDLIFPYLLNLPSYWMIIHWPREISSSLPVVTLSLWIRNNSYKVYSCRTFPWFTQCRFSHSSHFRPLSFIYLAMRPSDCSKTAHSLGSRQQGNIMKRFEWGLNSGLKRH